MPASLSERTYLPDDDPRVWWPIEALSKALSHVEAPKLPEGRKRRRRGSAPTPVPAVVVCAICRVRTDDKAADHCHQTGVVRDWLCRKCNAGLGFFDDNPERMRAAADYIERHRAAPGMRAFKEAERHQLSRRQFERRARAILSTAVVTAD